nr:MAG TPA: hypothetical protein [Caudoviricetes sp.]
MYSAYKSVVVVYFLCDLLSAGNNRLSDKALTYVF